MSKKGVSRFFMTVGSMIILFAFNFINLNLIGCGTDEAETESETEQLTDEEQKNLIRFVEYVLFPTTPYIDKSWVEIVPEEEVAEGEPIDFAAETAAIQQTFNEFYNAYNINSARAVLDTFWSRGIRFQGKLSKATARSYIETRFVEAKRGGGKAAWGPTPELAAFYIRRAYVQAPYPEASAYGFNGPSVSFDGDVVNPFNAITYLYLVKQGGRWLINQLSTVSPPQKYFDDPEYEAPLTTIEWTPLPANR